MTNLPPMPTAPPAVKSISRRTGWIIVASIAAVLAIVTTVVWMNGRSYEDTVAACEKAINSTSTKTNRPDACQDVKDDDYGTLLISWSLRHAFDDLPQSDQDTLDYYDNGTIDGSLG